MGLLFLSFHFPIVPFAIPHSFSSAKMVVFRFSHRRLTLSYTNVLASSFQEIVDLSIDKSLFIIIDDKIFWFFGEQAATALDIP